MNRHLHRGELHPSWLEPRADHEPAYTLDRQIALAREEMGPVKWAKVMAEWDAPEQPPETNHD